MKNQLSVQKLVLILSLLFSCNNKNVNTHSPVISEKDSLLKQYFKADTTIGLRDSNNTDFRLLLAYYNNNTGYLQKRLRELEERKRMTKEPYYIERQQHLGLSIDRLDYDEAYRVSYGRSFCNKDLDITVGIKNDSAFLYGLLTVDTTRKYPPYEKGATKYSTFKRSLNHEEWQTVLEKVDYVDFWGMQFSNYREGLDGSGLEIAGFRKGNYMGDDYKIIYRWASERSAIFELYKYVYKLSGVKADCLDFN